MSRIDLPHLVRVALSRWEEKHGCAYPVTWGNSVLEMAREFLTRLEAQKEPVNEERFALDLGRLVDCFGLRMKS